MTLAVREGILDVVIAAGPRVEHWPSVGVQILSLFCGEMGLSVGQFGGEHTSVKGLIPADGTGGWVFVEDAQGRLHRIFARSVVRISAPSSLPDPFSGWCSPGLVPIETAEKLERESQCTWAFPLVILGTGNRALRWGSHILRNQNQPVLCLESFSQWGGKRFAGWEVEKRAFEKQGGRILEGIPLSLRPLSPPLWEFRVQVDQEVQVFEVGRVVSAGPFSSDSSAFREYPEGSCLFELEQTAGATLNQNPEGWALEEARSRILAGKIAKNLVQVRGTQKEMLDRAYRRARHQLKKMFQHRTFPFLPHYEGKWLTLEARERIQQSSGVPKKEHLNRLVASVECFETISCSICQKVCPTSAIRVLTSHQATGPLSVHGQVSHVALNEVDCTACGKCVLACPSESISLLHEPSKSAVALITLPWKSHSTEPTTSQPPSSFPRSWVPGKLGILLNRRGETLGTARVNRVDTLPNEFGSLIQIEVPSHLVWEARAIRLPPLSSSSDEAFLARFGEGCHENPEKHVEITLNGETRSVRHLISISTALFETAHHRSEDILYCSDGSCGLCLLEVDGVHKLACQTRVHQGMVIRKMQQEACEFRGEPAFCSCLGILQSEVVERLKQGKLQSADAVLAATHVGEGRCHGQKCMAALRRILSQQGIDLTQWIDWRFPWVDWMVGRSESWTKTFRSLNLQVQVNPSGSNDSHDE